MSVCTIFFVFTVCAVVFKCVYWPILNKSTFWYAGWPGEIYNKGIANVFTVIQTVSTVSTTAKVLQYVIGLILIILVKYGHQS